MADIGDAPPPDGVRETVERPVRPWAGLRWLVFIYLVVLPAVALSLALLLSQVDEASYPRWLRFVGLAVLLGGLVPLFLSVFFLFTRMARGGLEDATAGLPPALQKRAYNQIFKGEPKARPDEVAYLRWAAQRMMPNIWLTVSAISGVVTFVGSLLAQLPGGIALAIPLWAGLTFAANAALYSRQRRQVRRFLANHPEDPLPSGPAGEQAEGSSS